jgi:hypothetical protein
MSGSTCLRGSNYFRLPTTANHLATLRTGSEIGFLLPPRISFTSIAGCTTSDEIFTYLADTGASVIWATSTPIRESVHDGIESPRWHLADLVAYNRLSVELAVSFGFRINDLYGRLAGAAAERLLMHDGVHFNQVGNQLIGKYVAAAIQACRV